MKPFEYSNASEMVINETGSLREFYRLTNELSKDRHVRFIGKHDDAYNIEWYFKYRGNQLALQYSIFNGVTLLLQSGKDFKAANKLAVKLKTTHT